LVNNEWEEEIEEGTERIFAYFKASKPMFGYLPVSKDKIKIIITELIGIAIHEGNASDCGIEVIYDGKLIIRPKVYIKGEEEE
jgi:hypothetical protein